MFKRLLRHPRALAIGAAAIAGWLRFVHRTTCWRIEGSEPDEHRVAFSGLGLPLYQDASVQVSSSDGTWVYARNVAPDPHPAELLFDRSLDPGENVNLIWGGCILIFGLLLLAGWRFLRRRTPPAPAAGSSGATTPGHDRPRPGH